MTARTGDTGDIIDILLATYNGEAFLEEQLDSIAAQTHGDWRLIARDDGSADRTAEILDAFRARHPDKVVVLQDGDGNLGLVANFSRLMERSDAPYAAFCDQDDVWMPEKLALCLAKMHELEREQGQEQGAEVPLLVFTDLTVVDEELKVIDPSFWHYQGLRPERCDTLGRLLLHNVVTGCTALLNSALVDRSGPVPDAAKVHDWWVALVAVALGRLGYISRPTVLYRQHGENLIGAQPLTFFSVFVGAYRLVSNYNVKSEKIRKVVDSLSAQGAALRERITGTMDEGSEGTLRRFLELPRAGLAKRIAIAAKYGILARDWIRTIVLLLFMHE